MEEEKERELRKRLKVPDTNLGRIPLIQKALLIFSFIVISFAAGFHLSDSAWYIVIGNIVFRTLGLFVLLNIMIYTIPLIFRGSPGNSAVKRIGFAALQIPLILLSIWAVC